MSRERRDWKKIDPVRYCKENYADLTRAELNKVDGGCYTVLLRRGLLRVAIPVAREYRDWDKIDMVAYVRAHYPGLSRKQLEEVDPGCCDTLRRRGLLEVAIPEKQQRDWGTVDVVAYVHEHYADLTQQQLKKADPGCHEVLRRRGLLRTAFPEKQRRDWETLDPLEYFREHYVGLTRIRLLDADRGCYVALFKRGLLNVAFPLNRNNADLEGMLDDIVGDDE